MRAVLDRAPRLPQWQGICREPDVHRWGAASGHSLCARPGAMRSGQPVCHAVRALSGLRSNR